MTARRPILDSGKDDRKGRRYLSHPGKLDIGEQGLRSTRSGRGRTGRFKEGSFGEDLDGAAAARWKVVLVRLVAERSHTFTIWLSTDGDRSCSVRLEWRLKPGFKVYERWALRREETVRFAQPVVDRAYCRAY